MLGLGAVGDVFVVDVYTVESEIVHELHSATGEVCAEGGRGEGGDEVRGVGIAADAEHCFERAVFLLEEVELLYVSIEVGAVC